MSKKVDASDKQNVVVVGGGFAGLNVAKELAKKLDKTRYNLILLTARPYFVNTVSAIRLTVADTDDLDKTSLIPYDKLQGITHAVGTVVAIDEREPGKGGVLTLKDGQQLKYRALVLATGSLWPGPIDLGDSDEEIRESIRVWRARYASARHVVVVGGGAVGIETVGEIKDVYSGTRVTLVHSASLLLNDTYPDKFRHKIEQRVRERGADIIFGDYIDSFPEPGVTSDIVTRKGQTIRGVDLVIHAYGAKPNTEYINTLDSSVLTKTGTVKVQPTLQVVGHPGVFAAGDIIEWKEQKQAGKAPKHASVVAANIVSFLAGTDPKGKYAGQPEMILIPVGKNYGAGYFDVLWGITLGNFFTRLIKGKTLFVPMARGNLGY